MTPELRTFLGGDAAIESLEGVRNGDRLFVVANGKRYLHRGYILFDPLQSRVLGDRKTAPVIAYCSTAPAERGRGLYRRALNAELSYLQNQGYKRALIAVDPGNRASRKGIEAAGFCLAWEVRSWIILNEFVVHRVYDHNAVRWLVLSCTTSWIYPKSQMK